MGNEIEYRQQTESTTGSSCGCRGFPRRALAATAAEPKGLYLPASLEGTPRYPMNVITHSLLPVTARQCVELRAEKLPDYKQQLYAWAAIGLFGSLPDILNPHISLGARYNSYSHVWPCTLTVVAICCLYGFLRRKNDTAVVALWCALAYVLHVVGDIVSGGLDFFCTGQAIGDWWIIPELWPVLDLFFVIAFVLLHRRIRKRHGLEPSIVRVIRRRFYGRPDVP